jgi:hypothetical protein
LKPVVIILLASKSSGSSAFQKYVQVNYGANLLEQTPHHENETLFWTKAASVLGLQQYAMHRSQVPYSEANAKQQLQDLLSSNGIELKFTKWSEEEIMATFRQLVLKNGPVFFEKSPHHLFNYSNLDLIFKFKDHYADELDVHVVGLIRNPLSTIYSAWKRWHFNCVAFELEWHKSYQNLQAVKRGLPTMPVFCYETLAVDAQPLDDYLAGLGLQKKNNAFKFHRESLDKVKQATPFKHQLSNPVIELAEAFGYNRSDMSTHRQPDLGWTLSEAYWSVKSRLRRLLQ